MQSDGKILIPKLGLGNESCEEENKAIPLSVNQERMKWTLQIPSQSAENEFPNRKARLELPSPFMMPNAPDNPDRNVKVPSLFDFNKQNFVGSPHNCEINNDLYNLASVNKIINTPYVNNTNLFNFFAFDQTQYYPYGAFVMSKFYFYQIHSPEINCQQQILNSNLLSPPLPGSKEVFDFKNRFSSQELPYEPQVMMIPPYYQNIGFENWLAPQKFVQQELPPAISMSNNVNKIIQNTNSDKKEEEKASPINLSPQEIRRLRIEKFKLKKIRLGWVSGRKKIKNAVVGKKYRVNGKFIKKARALELISIPLNMIASHPLILKLIQSKSTYALSATVEGVTFYNFDSLLQDSKESLKIPVEGIEGLIDVKVNKIDHHRKTIQINIDKKKETLEKSDNHMKQEADLSELKVIQYYSPQNKVYEVLRNNLKKVPISHFDQHLITN